MKRLAIITTHPIQYNAPLFRLLTERGKIRLKVFYTWSQSEDGNIFDPGFGIHKKWDIPLVVGYDYSFVKNTAPKPGSHHFRGIRNPDLISLIYAYQPDAVLVFGWSFQSHIRLMRHLKGRIPVFFRGDSTLLDEFGRGAFRNLVRRLFLRRVYRYVDFAFYAGENNRLYFLKNGLRPSQLGFMPHAIDNDRFATGGHLENYRDKLGLLPTEICILFAGKFEQKKDPGLLVESFMELQLPHVYLVMVGNGEMEQELKQKAVGALKIKFLPFQNQQQMPAIYQMADIFVLPSKGPGETWGLAVNEAMAAGKAVLVSDKCGCAADLVKEGENGFIFRAESATDLSGRLTQMIIRGKECLKGMGDRSREIISDWTYRHCAEAIESKLNTPHP